MNKGSFTMPGEAGYEKLTLELAKRWGADVIRDSDGTKLSEDITKAGYDIYSTICIIRDHNAWADRNPDKLQQTFLCTKPVNAFDKTVSINPMKDFFREQFMVNDTKEAMKYWEVYDRTTGEKLTASSWTWNPENETVTIEGCAPFHEYTLSFLAYRIWEEISMYNHVTNSWNKEHLKQIDPIWPETREYLRKWLTNWCEEHPETNVIRFTSLFYNFVWIWGSDDKCRNLFSDWSSYDFAVSDKALDLFAAEYGYSLSAEDFINGRKLRSGHVPPTPAKKDWMAFVNEFVISFGKELVDIAHKYNKKAYLFYDDSWIGTEPNNGKFPEFGLDGIIKCVFSGFEVRLCAAVPAKTHEIRLHPYLFPVGLGGLPTFSEGGKPEEDGMRYWINVRRGLLRDKIDRIGLGGYVHLLEGYPKFVDFIEKIADEFREIKRLHESGKPACLKTKAAVLHSWGKMRPWTLSGHFHETYMNDLIHVNEALAGMPLSVSFIDFDDVKNGALKEYDVLINAGSLGSAWSGGDFWKDTEMVTAVRRWVAEGGTLIGVGDPSGIYTSCPEFALSGVYGVEPESFATLCHGTIEAEEDKDEVSGFAVPGSYVKLRSRCRLTDSSTVVLAKENGAPVFTEKVFGKGKAFWLSSFETNSSNNRMLQNLILAGREDNEVPLCDNPSAECAYFPNSKMIVVINNSYEKITTNVLNGNGNLSVELNPCETRFFLYS